MTTIAIIEAVALALAIIGFVRVIRNFAKIDSQRMKYKEKYQSLECFEKPQFDAYACVSLGWDYLLHVKYWRVSLNVSDNRILRIRRFDFDQNDEDDKIYAMNCAQELCDMLNYDYRITSNKIENA